MASGAEQALRRLEAALSGLELAIERRLAERESADGLGDEVQMLPADRARLAESLDQAQARATRLESLNRDASRRIGAAMEAISAVLEATPEER
jgi:hypothetical protein